VGVENLDRQCAVVERWSHGRLGVRTAGRGGVRHLGECQRLRGRAAESDRDLERDRSVRIGR
jgi:hypothetical protein